MEIKIDTDERIISYLNQEICQQNWESIKEAITKGEQPKIQNPLMTKKIKPHQLRLDIINYNVYNEDIKKRNENIFKEKTRGVHLHMM